MEQQGRTVEMVLAQLATPAHGVVSRSELCAAGISPEEIRKRLRKGSLIRVHRGVYRVGHIAPSLESRYFAAVKACGDGALLCGRAAAHLWGLTRGSPPPPEVVAGGERRVPRVTVHRARRSRRTASDLPPADVSARELEDATRRRGIPITTVPRTLVDLASYLPDPALARACHEAEVAHGTTPGQVEEVLTRRSNARGAPTLRRILRGDVRVTLSRLESRFLGRLREAALPLPETNCPAGGRRVDCRWPQRQLTVELDGYRYHHSRHAWELDRRREREARARGDEFRRYTFGDVFEEPRFMLAELRALLSGRSPS